MEQDGVPRFIKQCTQIIEAEGLKIEGMYRVSGKKDVCLALQDQYDMGKYAPPEFLILCTVLCVVELSILDVHGGFFTNFVGGFTASAFTHS